MANGAHHTISRTLTANVDVAVVGVAAESMTSFLQELVEVVEHDVREQRREHSPYAKGNLCFQRLGHARAERASRRRSSCRSSGRRQSGEPPMRIAFTSSRVIRWRSRTFSVSAAAAIRLLTSKRQHTSCVPRHTSVTRLGSSHKNSVEAIRPYRLKIRLPPALPTPRDTWLASREPDDAFGGSDIGSTNHCSTHSRLRLAL